MPVIPAKISVQCDVCQKVFEYTSQEVMRFEADQVTAFEVTYSVGQQFSP